MATEDKALENYADDDFADIEVPDELMEQIAAGYMSDDLKSTIRRICANFKRNGNDLEHCKMFYRRLRQPGDPFTTWEMWDYMDEIWPTL